MQRPVRIRHFRTVAATPVMSSLVPLDKSVLKFKLRRKITGAPTFNARDYFGNPGNEKVFIKALICSFTHLTYILRANDVGELCMVLIGPR